MQIKTLKSDKKSLENKLELLIEKETSKFSNEQIQVMGNGTITYPVHVTTQEAAKSTEKKDNVRCWSTNDGSSKCTY
jgi:hypothetical protein